MKKALPLERPSSASPWLGLAPAAPLLVDPSSALILPVGTLPGGPTTVPIPVGVDLPLGSALVLRVQAVYVAPGSGSIVTGGAGSVVVLDSGL